MSLKEYFESHKGVGVLATADAQGNVDTAVYASPHFGDDGTIMFIMADGRSRANVEANPKASYLFIEEGQGYKGKRLYLSKVSVVKDADKVAEARRHKRSCPATEEGSWLVYFNVTEERLLVGG